MKKAKQVIIGIIDVAFILALLAIAVIVAYVQITTNPLATLVTVAFCVWFYFFVKRGLEKAEEHLKEEQERIVKGMEE